MDIFDILGYRSDRPYSVNSTTNVLFAAIKPSGINNYTLTANAGAYTLTGKAATLNSARNLSGSAGSYAITGNDASIGIVYALLADSGSYTIMGQEAAFEYNPSPVVVVESKGGIPKAKTHIKKNEYEDIAAIVKREFDILDGTYVPEVVEKVKQVVLPKVEQIDLSEYDKAIAQVNALLLQAKAKAAEYEAELDDEETLLMLL